MRIYYILFLISCLSVVSCRTTKDIATKERVIEKDVPSISENKLLKNIDNHELEYNTLFAKRIDASLSTDKGNNNFGVALRIQRDSFIQISVMGPLNIELARVLLTNDSVKFVDRHNKKYFIGNYDYFYDKFDIRMDYNNIQSILTNTFFNFNINDVKDKHKRAYKFNRTDEVYELSTVEEKALNRKIKKLHKKIRKNKDFILILQKISIDPQSFRPMKMLVKDLEGDIGVNLNYEMFRDFSGKTFPKKMSFDLFLESSRMNVILEFDKIEFDVAVKSNLIISSKYKRIE